MAAGGASANVMDGLKKLYTDIAGLQLLPDAGQHAQFLQGAQQAIQTYLGQQAAKAAQQSQMVAQQAAGQASQQAQGAAQGGMPGGMPPGAAGGGGMAGGPPNAAGPPPPPASIAPGGGAGNAGLNTMKNPDELRRILAGSSGANQ